MLCLLYFVIWKCWLKAKFELLISIFGITDSNERAYAARFSFFQQIACRINRKGRAFSQSRQLKCNAPCVVHQTYVASVHLREFSCVFERGVCFYSLSTLITLEWFLRGIAAFWRQFYYYYIKHALLSIQTWMWSYVLFNPISTVGFSTIITLYFLSRIGISCKNFCVCWLRMLEYLAYANAFSYALWTFLY